MTRGKRRVTHRGVATRVLGVLSGRPGLITTAESIAAQLGKDVTVGDVSSAVSYLRIQKKAPIERVAAGAYKWTETKAVADLHADLAKTTSNDVAATGGWVGSKEHKQYEAALGIPPVSVVKGGVQFGGVVAGIETRDDSVTRTLADDDIVFTCVTQRADLLILEDHVTKQLWVARKL